MKRYRKIWFFAIAIVLLSVALAVSVSAETTASGTCGDSLTWELSSDGVLTISGTGAMTDYSAGGAPWYNYRAQIDTVVISEGVTTVGNNAFYTCTSLASVTIPDSITKLGSNAFHTCKKLDGVTFGSGLTAINGSAFANCEALTSITIPATVKGNMASNVFYNCKSLTDVTIEEGVTKIPNDVFRKCISLTEITIPSTVTSIGSTSNSTFRECTNLKSVTFLSKTTTINPANETAIPAGVTVYGFKGSTAETYVGSYKDATGVTFVEIPLAGGTCGTDLEWELSADGVLTVKGTGAMADYNIREAPWYDYRTQIDTVVISEGVTTVGKNAFYNCTSLVSVTMADSVTKIVSNAFHTCSKLTEVTFGSGLTSIQGQSFANCKALTSITIPATVKGNMASYVFTNCSGLTDVTIEEGVTTIPNNVFNNCTSLTEITIPSTVTSIGSANNSTFAGCTNLKSVTFLSKTTTINPASAAAIPEGATVYGYAGSTAYEYAKNYGHDFIPFTEITAAQVALGTDITVNYYAVFEDKYAGAQMKFTVNGEETLVDGVKQGDEYVYAYTGIAPNGLGVNIKAELIFGGEVIASKDEYSVVQNCKNLLAKSATDLDISDAKYEAMETLIADLLAYGAAAQLYTGYNTDALVNEGIEGATEFVALDEVWSKLPTESTDATVDLLAAGLYFDNTNKLYFRFTATDITEENFKVKIGENEYTLKDFTVSGDSYLVFTEELAATELDTLYTVEMIKDGVTVQTLEYGVFAYVYNMQDNENQAMANLAKTTYNYGVSADAYAIAE